MHGFPDNLHLYDRLTPYLSPPRRVIAFDFLGWGASDKSSGYPYTTSKQVGDLDAVITQLRLQDVILVAHDASGPPAIDWAVRIIFGDADPYLNPGVARRFHELFSGSELFLVPGARHFVQMDEPAHVARLILALPGREDPFPVRNPDSPRHPVV
jgi:pimeloyl-ACP methyl ester carboxylesterase